MLLARFCATLALARALRGKTLAGDRVLNNAVLTLDDLARLDGPLISIHDGMLKGKVEHKALLFAEGTIDLNLWVFLPPQLAVGEATLDTLGKGAAAAFAIIGRQIETALVDPNDPWAAIWRDLVFKMGDVESDGDLIERDEGARIPAMLITFNFEPISEPASGAAPAGGWARLIAQMRTDGGDLSVIADLVESAIAGEPLPEWKRIQSELGLNRNEVEAIGVAPVDVTEQDEPAALDGMTVIGITGDDVELEP